MAHLHFVEDGHGDVVDHIVFCSDYCHREHTDQSYAGWNGCHEISTTEPCANCEELVC
jgi:hypothetical protein